MPQYAYQAQADTLRKQASDMIAAQQAYVNQQYGDYQKEKAAYEEYNDAQTRSQLAADAESQRNNHKWWKSALKGAGTGATTGSMISPGWGTLIGGLVGAVGGGIYGGVDQHKAGDEYKKYMSKVNSAPLGELTQADIGGGGLTPEDWMLMNSLGKLAGTAAAPVFKPNQVPEKPLAEIKYNDTTDSQAPVSAKNDLLGGDANMAITADDIFSEARAKRATKRFGI
jgi:hypothetical protein